MKTSKLIKFAWVFFALALATTTLFAQGWRNWNRANYAQSFTCVDVIEGLTDEQIDQIVTLENQHQKEMDELRIERRSTYDALEKNEIRGKMLKKVNAHRESVKKLLNEEQQKQYDLLHTAGFNYQNRPIANQERPGFNQGRRFGRGCMGNRNGAGFRRGNNFRNGGCPYYRQNLRNTGRGRGYNYNN
jgi:hypothetical protein